MGTEPSCRFYVTHASALGTISQTFVHRLIEEKLLDCNLAERCVNK